MLVDSLVQAMWQIHSELCMTHQEDQETSEGLLVCLVAALVLIISLASLALIIRKYCIIKKLSPKELTREGKLKFLNFKAEATATCSDFKDPLVK